MIQWKWNNNQEKHRHGAHQHIHAVTHDESVAIIILLHGTTPIFDLNYTPA